MSNLRQNITSPIMRLLWGSMTEPQTKDAEGKPLVIKSGPDAGKPTQRFAFGGGVPKAPGQTHWANKPATWDTDPATAGTPYWGEQIWQVGHASFPNGQAQRPDFAWKVIDGDSQVPNKKGVKPCDREGYPGHWIVSFSSSFAPKVCNADGTNKMYDPKAIKCGHFIQVLGTVDGNNSPNQPGVYVNHDWVAHSGFGEEIHNGSDPSTAGFGKGPKPVGMSAVPVGGFGAPAAPGAAPAPAALPAPAPLPAAAPLPTPAPLPAAAPLPSAAPPAPTAVAPNPAILGAAPPPPPAAAVVAPPPAAPQMTAKATATYDQYRAGGWTDEQLRAHGFMV
jgi:hypothetical protein